MCNRNSRLIVGLLLVASSTLAQADDMAQDVRAVLSNRCFACHGPDDAERQGGFRLDLRASFLAAADSGLPPVVPGNARESELFRRVLTDESAERMPPPSFAAKLSQAEIDLIRQWLDEGAEMPQHWSFVAPHRPRLPVFAAGLSQAERNYPSELESDWLHHAIDRFVLAKQVERGMRPSEVATKSELLRRLSLDLIGLPPSPEQVDAFERDQSPDAYLRQVERLLASPALGEHWARKWLDLARYADSAGYADDPPRTIWAYRDWVIKALNSNMPIDDFTIYQIAGDLLPSPSQEHLVATAFHRNTLTNNEGGTNDEEFRSVAVVDRVNTTMAVWMGVTMACAQCHTHKYDPFTQAEYFQLYSVFNQSQDADRRDESPTLELLTATQQADKQLWQQRFEELELRLSEPSVTVQEEFARWDDQLTEPSWSVLNPIRFEANSKSEAEFLDDGTIRVQATGNVAAKDRYWIDLEIDGNEPVTVSALGLRTMPAADLPQAGAGLGNGNFVLTGVTASVELMAARDVKARFARIELPGNDRILSLAEVEVFSGGRNVAPQCRATQSSTDYGGQAKRAIDGNTNGDYEQNSTTHTSQSDDPWWEVDLQQVFPIDRIVIWNRTGNGVHSRLDGAKLSLLSESREVLLETDIVKAPKTKQEFAVRPTKAVKFEDAYADYAQSGFAATASVDGKQETGWAVGGDLAGSHLLTLVPEEPITLSKGAKLRIELEHDSVYPQHLLGRFRVEATTSRTASDWAAMTPEQRAIQLKLPSERSPEESRSLQAFFGRQIAPCNSELREEFEALSLKLGSLKPKTSVPVMREVTSENRRETFVQIRGNYKSRGAKVEPGTPAVFHSVEPDGEVETIDRLVLANWLVDRKNPLTARVWVNRMWESLFGIGIVRSSEDFGSQGDRPSHPDLLDWLAIELMESGWDNKHMLRLIVTSNTYRQTSRVSPQALAEDKDNIWLARGPRVRLSAEMVRDQALAVSGLLSRKMFGEPTRPPQPDMGLKAAFGGDTDWKSSAGEDRYRRGVYTTWRRSNPYPSMVTFDAPSREVCTLRRDSTNTPLQALVTLNDPSFFEAAQELARWVVLRTPEAVDDQQKIEAAFARATNRPASPKEIDALVDLLHSSRKRLRESPEAALALATDPIGPLPEGTDAVELAAFSALCNVLLNLDEVLMKR